jgi:hypothetical protein
MSYIGLVVQVLGQSPDSVVLLPLAVCVTFAAGGVCAGAVFQSIAAMYAQQWMVAVDSCGSSFPGPSGGSFLFTHACIAVGCWLWQL